MSARTPRILFASFPEPGHLTPLARVAIATRRLGAEVLFFSLERDVSGQLRAMGFDAPVQSIGCCGPPAETSRIDEYDERARTFANRARNRTWYARWLQYVLLEHLERQAEGVAAFAAAARVDLVVTDPLAYAVIIAATRAGLPWAAVAPLIVSATPREWQCPYREILGGLMAEIAQAFTAAGLPGPRLHEADVVSPWLNVLQASETLTPRALSGNDYAHYAGPFLGGGTRVAGFPWEVLDTTRPRVYLASGTQFVFPDSFELACAEAAAAAGCQLIAAGPTAKHVLAGRPGVVTVPFAPQLALLDRVDLMITHGGVNSTLEALSRGCPLLVAPLGHEQPIQAMMIEHAAAGLWLRESDWNREELAAAFRRLVADQPMRKRVAALGETLRAEDGARSAAELVLRLARERRPIPPVAGPVSSSDGR